MEISAKLTSLSRLVIFSLISTSLALVPQVSLALTPGSNGCELPLGDGSQGSPFQISSELELREAFDCVDRSPGQAKYFLQTANITGSGPWESLGSTTSPFVGIYDGGGHAITSIVIDDYVQADYGNNQHGSGVGLFRAVGNSVFRNLTLEVLVDIDSPNGVAYMASIRPNRSTGAASIENVGALSGWAHDSVFENIQVSFSATITSGATGFSTVGGLIGRGSKLEGFNPGATSTLVFNNVHAQFTNQLPLSNYLGGIVSRVGMATNKTLFISQSSAIITMVGSGTIGSTGLSGGLVGMAEGNLTIQDSFSRGEFTLTAGSDRVGGLVGQHCCSGTASFSNSYAAVAFNNYSNQPSISPIVNKGSGARPISISQVFWDSDLTTATDIFGAEGKTALELNDLATFTSVGWDIAEGYEPTKTWGIHPSVNEGYPFLNSAYSADPTPTPPNITSAATFNVVEGETSIANLSATPVASWSLVANPSGLFAIEASSGTLTINPSAQPGSYLLTVRATGANGGFSNQQLTITVTPPTQATTGVGSSPAVVLNTPEITNFSTRQLSAAGGEIRIEGRRLSGISELTLGGNAVTIVSNTDTTLVFVVGNVPTGTWDLRLVGSNGTLTFQQAITVVEAQIVTEANPGTLIGYTWTLRFSGNSRVLNSAQEAHLLLRLNRFGDAETIICWGYTTAASPNAWAIAHATARAKAACDFASANNPSVKTVVRLRYGVEKNFAMRSALQFWK